MQKSDFPCWLQGKDKAAAQALLDMGFWYCGLSENFVVYEEIMIRHRGWLLGGSYQEQALDAVCGGALFVCDVEDDRSFKEKFRQAKLTISKAIEKFNEPLGVQLRLPIC
jgi:hypothetical protein